MRIKWLGAGADARAKGEMWAQQGCLIRRVTLGWTGQMGAVRGRHLSVQSVRDTAVRRSPSLPPRMPRLPLRTKAEEQEVAGLPPAVQVIGGSMDPKALDGANKMDMENWDVKPPHLVIGAISHSSLERHEMGRRSTMR